MTQWGISVRNDAFNALMALLGADGQPLKRQRRPGLATSSSGIPVDPDVKEWRGEIDLYERTMQKWMQSSRKLMKRYKDVRSPAEEAITRVNILWSNVQTRLPALYARDPKPEVERRFKDKDPVGRQVAEVLERALDFTVQHVNPFGEVMRQVVLDYELPGRGTVWVRYMPTMRPKGQGERDEPNAAPLPDEDDPQIKAPQSEDDPLEVDTAEEDTEELHDEQTMVDYVSWEDFGHTWARVWAEVRAVWRRVYLDRTELRERFTNLTEDEIKSIPLDWVPKNLKEGSIRTEQKKAVVYEIWDKRDRKALWVCKNFSKLLDEKDDPLELEHFFPCPRPMYANLTSDELIPTPNFRYYQDQAREIDELATRIVAIGKALKVAGVRDSSAPGLDRLLAEGVENQLVPIDGWMALKEKGGIKGVMELLPLDMIAEALGYLRDQLKLLIDQVYEITGLSDIIRGLSDPNETATAQQIKGQFAVLRISDSQTEVQRFCRDTIRIIAEVVSDYSLDTLKAISGVKLLTNAEKEAIHAQLQAAQQAAQLAAAQHGPPNAPGPMGQPGPSAAPPHPGMPPMPGAGGMPVPMGGGAPGSAPPQPGQPAPNAPMPGAHAGPPGPPPSPGAGLQPPTGVAPNAVTPGAGQQMPGPDQLKLMKEPSWEEVEALLQNPVLREFRIDIETDSTIRTDEDADRAARMDFVEKIGEMIKEAASVPKPMIPAVGEVMLFAIRGFKVARNLERVFEEAFDQLKDMPTPPPPEMLKAQADQETAKAVAQVKAQADIEIADRAQQAQAREDQLRTQAEAQRSIAENQAKSQSEQALTEQKNRFEAERTQFETASKERIAQADNQTKFQIAEMEARHKAEQQQRDQTHEATITSMTQSHEKAMAVHKSEHDKGMADKQAEHSQGLERTRGENALKVASSKPNGEAKAA